MQPRLRFSSATAETVKIFAQWQDAQANLINTADQTWAVAAGVISTMSPPFGHLWDANDMNGVCRVFIKTYCTSGTPANVNITASYQDGYGMSKRAYDDNAGINWTV